MKPIATVLTEMGWPQRLRELAELIQAKPAGKSGGEQRSSGEAARG